VTNIIPKGIECPGCGTPFEAYLVLSVYLTGDEHTDREECAMIENLTRNECPNCGRRASQEEVGEAPEKRVPSPGSQQDRV
jgi:hypothetical protein